jgi:hypothetical protein
MNRSRSAGRRVLVGVAASTALLSAGGSWAVAASQDDRSPADQRGLATSTAAAITGTSLQGSCKVGFDTQTGSVVPPDDSTSDNPAAASVTMKKQCAGAVVAEFSSEVAATTSAPGSMHLDLRATCVGTGGTTDPCTVGQTLFAQPGHTFLADGVLLAEASRTHGMQMVFPALKRGLWRFEALPGSSGGSALLGFRTLVVTAYTGG